MSPRKLTAADKKAIVSTYRSSPDSMAVLATRYGVSNSTVSRLLKNNIPELEYESLIADKRSQKGDFGEEETLMELPIGPDDETLDEKTLEDLPPAEIGSSRRRVRRRSSAPEGEEGEMLTATGTPRPITKAQKASIEVPIVPELAEWTEQPPEKIVIPRSVPVPMPMPVQPASEAIEEDDRAELSSVASLFGEDMGDLLDDDEDDFAEDEGWNDLSETSPIAISSAGLQVQPLSTATLPRTCYIVVDKFAELVACPLGDFAQLGQSSAAEKPQTTLPVFDNHRVAKRFSNNRNQRVIKVPDSRVFQKTTRHLSAKGISLLLVDGQIYSLN
jgi:hypothetical protein